MGINMMDQFDEHGSLFVIELLLLYVGNETKFLSFGFFIQGLEMMLEALVEVEGPAQEGQVETDVGQQCGSSFHPISMIL